VRTEATGYGLVFFVDQMLRGFGGSFDGKTVVVSGSGNVAQYAIEKVHQLGGRVVTCSDSDGYVVDEAGIDLDLLKEIKSDRSGRVHDYAAKRGAVASFARDGSVWNVPCDIALPCATQNELNHTDATALVRNGCRVVAEGANMPTTPAAVRVLAEAGVAFAPGKAANAGGVAVSGLEMSQNSARISWKEDELQRLLVDIMGGIHASCMEYGGRKSFKTNDYVKGANIAGFKKVADAMLAFGVV